MKKFIEVVLVALAILFLAAQFVRPDFTNPPTDPSKVLRAPAHVQPILDRSCNDCHSNRTRYPWYSRISPVSWWLKDHIEHGREELNFSEFGRYDPKEADHLMEEVCEMVEKGEMPLREYLWGHRGARLSAADKEALCAWSREERARIRGAGGM